MRYVAAAGGDDTPVLVIRLHGAFVWITTGPPGHTAATGTVMTLVADARTGEVTDTGLERHDSPPELRGPVVLYTR